MEGNYWFLSTGLFLITLTGHWKMQSNGAIKVVIFWHRVSKKKWKQKKKFSFHITISNLIKYQNKGVFKKLYKKIHVFKGTLSNNFVTRTNMSTVNKIPSNNVII